MQRLLKLKKTAYLILITVFAFFLQNRNEIKAQAATDTTVLEGFIGSSTSLKAGGIYLINHNLKISNGATLTIEKNVTVLFTHTSTLVVEGGLVVDGAPNSFVNFLSKDNEYRGAGIVIRGSEGQDISIKYAKFQKLSMPLNFEMNWYRANINIENSLFRDVNTGESAIVVSMPLGAFLGQTSKVTNFNFTNNNFINNWGSIFFENFQDNILKVNFSNNVITNNVVYGIDKGIPSNTPVFGLFDDVTRKYLINISENSIYGNYQINASTDTIIREISFGVQGKGEKMNIPNNFYRSTDPLYINTTFDHFYQNNELPLLVSEPFLRVPSARSHAHIYKVHMESNEVKNYDAIPEVGKNNVPFEVYFNRPVTPIGNAQLKWVYYDTTNRVLKQDTLIISNAQMSGDKKIFTFNLENAEFLKNKLGYLVISNFIDESGFDVPEFPIGQVRAINTYNKLYYSGLQTKYFNPTQMINNNLGSGKLIPEEMDIEKLEELSELGDLSYLGAYTSLAKTWEVGVFGGTSNYMGDLAFKVMDKEQFRWSWGVFGQYNISKWFSAKLQYNMLRISGNDIFDPDLGRRARFANFRNNIQELALTFHFHILQYGISKGERFSPSAYIGLAVFHHNPQARIVLGLDTTSGDPVYLANDKGQELWFDLRSIGTEGQTASSIDAEFPERKVPGQYSKIQISVPMGINLDFIVRKSWVIGVDIGFRMTFTDYLDDVANNYFDRANAFQAIVDANPVIQARTKAFGKKENVPLTFVDLDGQTHNVAAALAAPSIIITDDKKNDAFNFPDARRGDDNRDWYIPIGVKLSKVFGYNKYERQAKKAAKEEAKYQNVNSK